MELHPRKRLRFGLELQPAVNGIYRSRLKLTLCEIDQRENGLRQKRNQCADLATLSIERRQVKSIFAELRSCTSAWLIHKLRQNCCQLGTKRLNLQLLPFIFEFTSRIKGLERSTDGRLIR